MRKLALRNRSQQLLACCVFLVIGHSAQGQTSQGQTAQGQTADPTPGHCIVVRPSAWASTVGDWREFREAQGYSFSEVDAELGQPLIQEKIEAEFQRDPESVKFVLLVGDVDPRVTESISTYYRDSTAMVQFGGDKRIATDNPYGDMDGDDSPELCVARIPADTAEEVESFFAKVIEYEKNTDFATWRRDVHIIAGVGGFGALADSIIEMTTRRFLSDRIPGWSRLTMTQASIGSHFCPDPWRFSEACINRMNQGGMFWVYIGHGHVRTLDYVKAGEEYLPIFNEQHLPAIKSQHPPVAVFLACYTGAFDAIQDSLAERLTLNPNGPLASIAASRVSGPYGLATMADGMLRYCYEQRIPTLGEIFVESKRRMLKPVDDTAEDIQSSNGQMQMIESIAQAMSPKDYDLLAERREHVWQMHLIGDPLLSIRYPRAIELDTPMRTEPGQTIKVRGVSLMPGKLTLEFGYRRAKIQRELDDVPVALDTQGGRDAFQERYQRANDRTLVRLEDQVEPGPFERELQLPDKLSNGRYRIRAFIAGDSDWQAGYREFTVRRPRKQDSQN